MADFCAAHWPEVWGQPPPGQKPGFNDMLDIAPPGHVVQAFCETCGPGWFDSEGRRSDAGQ